MLLVAAAEASPSSSLLIAISWTKLQHMFAAIIILFLIACKTTQATQARGNKRGALLHVVAAAVQKFRLLSDNKNMIFNHLTCTAADADTARKRNRNSFC